MSKFREQLNKSVLESISSESQGEDVYKAEVVLSPELKSLSNSLNEVQEKIDADQNITLGDLLALKKVLGNSKVEIEGKEFTLEEVGNSEELKRNMEIWTEIEAHHFGRVSELTLLPPKIAKILVEYAFLQNFRGLTSLSVATANALSKYNGFLDFAGLKSLSVGAAEALSTHKGALDLSGLRSLTDKAAEALSKYKDKLFLYPKIEEQVNKFK